MTRTYVRDGSGRYVPVETTRAQRAAASLARTAARIQSAAAHFDVDRATAIARETAMFVSPVVISVKHNRGQGASAGKIAGDAMKVGIPLAAAAYARIVSKNQPKP